MAHGNIYGPDKVDAALGNYFRPGNLAALRELALLWVADRVDESLQEYRERHGIAAPWETRERVAVAVTGAPGNDNLIRRAVAHREPVQGRSRRRARARRRRARHARRRGARSSTASCWRSWAARTARWSASDVAKALVQAARAEGATQLVLGASHRSRWDELTRGSIIGGIIREAGRALDVHVISTSGDGDHRATAAAAIRTRLTPLPRRRQVAGLLLAVIGLPLLTLLLTPFRSDIGFTSAAFCYLMLVVLVATVGGRWPAALAAVAGFALLNWFFAEPIHTFTIRNERDLAAVAAFLLVAAVVSTLVDVSARRAAEASRGPERGRGARRHGRVAAAQGRPDARAAGQPGGPVPARPRRRRPHRT